MCAFHSDRETGRSCTRCGRPACSQCLVDAPVGSHCRACVADSRPPMTERMRRLNATSGPVVTKLLVAISLAVFAATSLQGLVPGSGLDVPGVLGLFGPAVAAGDWYRLVSSGFVHFGLFHLGFNMLALYRFGGTMEPELGRTRFLALYVASLLAGSLGALLADPLALTAGASGAMFGLIGASAVTLRRQGISVWQSDIGGLLLINLVFTFAIPGISIGGHLGGLVGGAIVAWAMSAGESLSPKSSQRATWPGLAAAAAVSAVSVLGALMWVSL